MIYSFLQELHDIYMGLTNSKNKVIWYIHGSLTSALGVKINMQICLIGKLNKMLWKKIMGSLYIHY